MKDRDYPNQTQPINEYALSSGQKGLWFLHQLDPLSDRYNIPLCFSCSAKFSIDEWERVLIELINRHTSLKSTFVEKNCEPICVTREISGLSIDEHDISSFNHEEIHLKVKSLSSQVFNLVDGPLIRVDLLKGYENKNILLITIHHLVFDGASFKLLFKELDLIYHAILNNKELNKPEFDYKLFPVWQQQWLSSEEAKSSRAFWMDQMSGDLPQLNLPMDIALHNKEFINGKLIKFEIPTAVWGKFKQIATDHRCSEYVVWLTAYCAFLARYTAQNDIIVGTPTMGRPEAKYDDIIGYFVNMVPLRCQLKPSGNFLDLLTDFKGHVYEALMHANYPLSELINDLGNSTDRGDQPLFQASFIWQEIVKLTSEDDSLLAMEYLPILHASGENNLSIDLLPTEKGISGFIKYRTNCFSETSIERFKNCFLHFVNSIHLEPDCELQELSLVSEEDENYLLHTLNQTKADYPKSMCIHHLFEQQVIYAPNKIALIFAGESLTYTELNSRANQLAHHLKETVHGNSFKTDTLIGLCVKRSIDLIVSLLAIFKSGCAYVPIDPDYPDIRIKHIIKDSDLSLIITQQAMADKTAYQGCKQFILNVEELKTEVASQSTENIITEDVDGESLAYVIYTSGSTGQPKGVMQKHGTVINLVHGQASSKGLFEAMKTMQFASISFDVSVQEIATSWYTQSPLILFSEDHKSALNQLPQFLHRHEVNRIFLPPAVLNWLAEELIRQNIYLPELKEIIVAGEALVVAKHLRAYLKTNEKCVLWNHYGPTETHVVTSAIVDSAIEYTSEPIGKALQNTTLFVLDQNQEIVPYGAVGELYVGGAGLAKGYLGQADLTAEKFIQNPYSYEAEDVLYRTGDLVRYFNAGQMVFIGRIDDQVKIRGFRVEIGEVEQQLSVIPGVNSSVVIVYKSNDQQNRLIAYLIRESPNENLSDDEFLIQLRMSLYESMPDYMVPSSLVILEEFPLNLNGKIDKHALPVPDQTCVNAEFMLPEGETQHTLASIWAQLLTIPQNKISANASFFELGGHSLLAAKLINDIKIKLDTKITYKEVFIYPTLSHLSDVIEKKQTRKTLLNSIEASTDDSLEEMEW